MSHAITIVEHGGIIRSGSMDEIRKQIELLAQFNLPASSAERYEVVIRDGYKVLRKREKPIKFVISDSKYSVPEGDTHLPSEAFYRRTKPSRYDDENRATAVSFVEIKEAFYS